MFGKLNNDHAQHPRISRKSLTPDKTDINVRSI